MVEIMITRQTLIGDIIAKHPEVVETLLDFGVQCVGCHVSEFESIEDGFRSHGMSEEEIETSLEKLNSIAKPIKTESNEDFLPELNVSDSAIAKISELCEKQNKLALRVVVKVGGCSGNKYHFELSEESNDNDFVIERSSVKVFIDKVSLQKINGSELDYLDALSGAGFKINNPQAKSVCGCGVSFN